MTSTAQKNLVAISDDDLRVAWIVAQDDVEIAACVRAPRATTRDLRTHADALLAEMKRRGLAA